MTDAQRAIKEYIRIYGLEKVLSMGTLYEQIEYLSGSIGGEDVLDWLLPLYKDELLAIKTKQILGGDNEQ
jgi:hypothetical protein